MALNISSNKRFYYDDLVQQIEDFSIEVDDMLSSALESIVYDKNKGPFVICDFGTGCGGNTISFIKNVIGYVQQKYGENTQFLVVYEDLPTNDFTNIFLYWQELKEIGGTDKLNNVYVTSSGTSLFSQCLPNSTLHLAFCFTAVNYLTALPCYPKDHILYMHSNHEDKKQFSKQATRDWERFLKARSMELAPGGQLLLVSLAADNSGQYHTKSSRSRFSRYQHLYKHWTRLLQEGRITKGEHGKAAYAIYFRTEDEFRAPFLNKPPISHLKDIHIVSMETKVIPNNIYERFLLSDKSPARAKEYANVITEAVKIWSSHLFTGALSNNRTDVEKNEILSELYKYLEEDIMLKPSDYPNDGVMCFIHVKKDG